MATEVAQQKDIVSPKERGLAIGNFQDWVLERILQLPEAHKAFEESFRGNRFNHGPERKAGTITFSKGDKVYTVQREVHGNSREPDGQEGASKTVKLEVEPIVDSQIPEQYFRLFSNVKYVGDAKTDTVADYTNGELVGVLGVETICELDSHGGDLQMIDLLKARIEGLLGGEKQTDELTSKQLGEQVFQVQQDLIDKLKEDPTFVDRYGKNFGSHFPVIPEGESKGTYWLGEHEWMVVECRVSTPERERDPNENNRFLNVTFFNSDRLGTVVGNTIVLDANYQIDPITHEANEFVFGEMQYWNHSVTDDSNPLLGGEALIAAREKLAPILERNVVEPLQGTPAQ